MEQTITTFYQFADLSDFRDWKERLEETGIKEKVLGTIILGRGRDQRNHLRTEKRGRQVHGFDSFGRAIRRNAQPFHFHLQRNFLPFAHRDKGRNRNPRRSRDRPDRSRRSICGTRGLECLIKDPDVLLVDTRNDYEVELGTFNGAVDPHTQNFSQWPDFVKESLEKSQKRKIAMFCTGGIRCEKASSHLLQNGFEEVYHLRGGILHYLEKISPEESQWEGECFVFHHQVSVTHGLKDGKAVLCFGCRWPLTNEDLSSPITRRVFRARNATGPLSDRKRESLRERQRQVELARKRRENHIGRKMPGSDLP